MVITGETDAEAEAKWELYKEGADLEALAWLVEQATADKNPAGDSNVRHAIDPRSMVNINIGLLLGSHATVARMLDEMATIPGLAGVLLTFDEFVSGTEIFGERIQPLMKCRQHVTSLGKGRRMTEPVSYFPSDDPAARYLPARPEPIMIRPAETALIIVDMQNAYASPGGYLDHAGFDISGAAPVIDKISEAAAAARAAGVQVVFFQNGWDPDYVEAGGPGSPNWHKSNALKTMRAKPELYGKLLAKGGWDYELVEALPPQPGDIVVAQAALQRLLQHQPRQPAARRAASAR